MNEMKRVTQANAASAEESASAGAELLAQAKDLGEMVQVLLSVVLGSEGHTGLLKTTSASPTRDLSDLPGRDWSPQPIRKSPEKFAAKTPSPSTLRS